MLVGEFGTKLQTTSDKQWLTALATYLGTGADGIHWTYWSWNPNSGDTGGILNDDWHTIDEAKQAMLVPLQFRLGGLTSLPPPCTVNYTVTDQWQTGFNARIVIANSSTVNVDGWHLAWTFAANQRVTAVWGGVHTQTGASVAVSNTADNPRIPAGGRASFGFEGSYAGANAKPSGFSLNGTTCTTGGSPSTPPPSTPPPAASTPESRIACTVHYAIRNAWDNGFVADVTIVNRKDALRNWNVAWSFPGNQRVTHLWDGVATQAGPSVTVGNTTWNGSVASGGTMAFGFQAAFSGANALPSAVTLNGAACVLI